MNDSEVEYFEAQGVCN